MTAERLFKCFEESPWPPALARHLLHQALPAWRETRYHWGLQLALSQVVARLTGKPDDAGDAELTELGSETSALSRLHWYLFTDKAYEALGGTLFSFWALTLIRICRQSEEWEEKLLAVPVPEAPPILEGPAPADAVVIESIGWRDEFLAGLRRALSDGGL